MAVGCGEVAVFHAVLALIADGVALVIAHKVQVLLVAGVVVFQRDWAAGLGVVHQNLCLAGEGLLDVDLLALTQVDIVSVVLEFYILQGRFRAAKVFQIDAVLAAADRTTVELYVAVITGAVNDRGVRICGGDRAAVHTQCAAVIDGAVCV